MPYSSWIKLPQAHWQSQQLSANCQVQSATTAATTGLLCAHWMLHGTHSGPQQGGRQTNEAPPCTVKSAVRWPTCLLKRAQVAEPAVASTTNLLVQLRPPPTTRLETSQPHRT